MSDKFDISFEDENKNASDIALAAALEKEFVTGARAFEFENKIVVAMTTTPFFLKSERDSSLKDIQLELEGLLPDKEILATFDVTVFRRIFGELTDKDKESLYRLALKSVS